MAPPMAMVCKCRPLSFLARGDSAVACAAASTSNTLPLAAGAVLDEACESEARLKLSMKRLGSGALSLSRSASPCDGRVGDAPGVQALFPA